MSVKFIKTLQMLKSKLNDDEYQKVVDIIVRLYERENIGYEYGYDVNFYSDVYNPEIILKSLRKSNVLKFRSINKDGN